MGANKRLKKRFNIPFTLLIFIAFSRYRYFILKQEEVLKRFFDYEILNQIF